MISPQRIIFAAVTGFILSGGFATADPGTSLRGTSVVDTPHNLSISGGGGVHGIKSTIESRVCIFCHTVHHSTSVMPLWSRDLSDQTYSLYQPASMVATLQQPRGSSRLCLSCHDGTIALGLLTRNYDLDPALRSFGALAEIQAETDPRKNPNLGTDLSDDHPISFIYTPKPELLNPAGLSQSVKLENEGYVECISCHNPHNNQNGNFLRVNSDLQHDALCNLCHIPAGWSIADNAHQTGGTRYDQGLRDGIKKDGCMSCHLSHNAPGPVSLQKGQKEEETCLLACHQDPPYKNVMAEFAELYRHPIQNYDKVHAVNEVLPLNETNKHVECVDCHNPHQAGWQDAPLDSLKLPQPPFADKPLISGALRGVRGETGPAFYEYQVCFKCHAGPAADSFAGYFFRPERTYATFDERERFASTTSSHPVVVTNQAGFTGRSLKADYQSSMKSIYCVDCHDPHGASQPHILKAVNPDTFPTTGISPESDYALCFRCHESLFLFDPVRNNSSAALHNQHVLGQYQTPGADTTRRVPCASCHDPHGLPAGGTTWLHLINFDKRYAGPGPAYNPVARSCSVAGACHTVAPQNQVY